MLKAKMELWPRSKPLIRLRIKINSALDVSVQKGKPELGGQDLTGFQLHHHPTISTWCLSR